MTAGIPAIDNTKRIIINSVDPGFYLITKNAEIKNIYLGHRDVFHMTAATRDFALT